MQVIQARVQFLRAWPGASLTLTERGNPEAGLIDPSLQGTAQALAELLAFLLAPTNSLGRMDQSGDVDNAVPNSNLAPI